MAEGQTPPIRPVVLVVDDEPSVLRVVSATLSMAGFRVLVADSGAAGLEIFRLRQAEICLVLADVVMPGMSGCEMAEAIREIEGTTRLLLMSGYSESEGQAAAHHFPLIRKPFLPGDLVRQIHSILGRAAEA